MASGESIEAKEFNKQKLHDFRVKVDACINEAAGYLSEVTAVQGKREMALVRTKLQEAKMWIGKVLEENDSPLPPEFQDKA